jgi:hypothetical protein
MNAHVEGREQGAALAKMSGRQIWTLLGMLWTAFEKVNPAAAAGGDLRAAMADKAHPFHAWRHATCGRLSEGRNEDYLQIAEFALRLAGREGAADKALFRNETEGRRLALHMLGAAARECEAAARIAGEAMDGLAYARGFLRNRCSVGLDEASSKQIWHAYYLLQRKAMLLRRKAGGRRS